MLLDILKIFHLASILIVPALGISGLIKLYKKKSLIGLFICFLSVIFFCLNYSAIRFLEKPIRLQKEDIIGQYNIDTDFFPGKNANWQHDNYSFEITKNDKFILNHSSGSKLTYDLVWSTGPPYLWTIKKVNHQIINSPVTLYRSHFKFYYVFKSSKWGNMFFRKVN